MIEIKNLNKTYHLKSGDVEAAKNVSLTIEDGEIYGIIGYSGAASRRLFAVSIFLRFLIPER